MNWIFSPLKACACMMLCTAAAADGPDWLLDPTPYKAEIQVTQDRIVLSNGLVRREITTKPEASTVSIKCIPTGEEFVRSPGPEAWVTIDGERYNVGGIEGAPLENYFRPQWLAGMKPAAGAYRYRSCRMEPVEKPLAWKKRAEWLSDDLPWPPKGRRIVMTYAPPEGDKEASLGNVALEQKFLEPWGADWREVLWTTTNRTSCCNEGKPGEIFTQAGTYAYLEHDWPAGAYYLSAVVSANIDSDQYCWGPAIAVDFPGRDGKMHHVAVFPRAAAREYEAGPDGSGTFFGSFDPAKSALLELFRRNGYWIARASQKGAAPATMSIPDEYGEPVKFRVGKLGYNRSGLLLPKGKDRVHCPDPPGEWTLSHLHEVTCRLPPSGGGGKGAAARALPEVEIAYEIYDGVPAMSKGIKIVNATTNAVSVDAFAAECVKLVERPYLDQRGPAHFNIHVESDYAVDCAGRVHGDANRTVRFLPDANYGTQINFRRAAQARLEVGPAVGPAQVVEPGETFDGIRAYELLFDSTDKTRRELSFCRFYRTLVPWAMENPLLFHCTDSSFAGLSNGVEQCAAAGFDICTASFRCGFDMENTDKAYIDAAASVSRYARSKGVVFGAYSLTVCRNAYRLEDQVVNAPDGAPFPKRYYQVSPCLCSESGMEMMNRFRTFIEQGELGFWENDGPYSGDVCCATNHPGHRGVLDSEWNQMQVQKKLYARCRELGVYVNQPAWLFFHGGSNEGIGYSEQHWSLPRDEQVLIERQNIYKGTWVKPIQMSWGFIPLCMYHGGGDAAVLEPLEKNLAVYDRRMANTIGAGLKCIQRGTRLYDTPKTLAMLRKWTDFRRRHRRVLDGDFIHLRCADGRDWDGWLKVRATGDERALAFLFNPLDEDIIRTIDFPLYYAGLPDETRTVSIPANGYSIIEFRAPAAPPAEKELAEQSDVEISPLAFERGGWGLDQQSMAELGTPYLIAHGLGEPVADAKAAFELEEGGRRRVWARTRNWHDGAPGRFRVAIDGVELPHEFGAGSPEWSWEDGGEVELSAGRHVVSLRDSTGFDGRCAGVVIGGARPPEGVLALGAGLAPEEVRADLVVVGAGPAGTAAAIAAARRGLKVALLNDRGVVGGNSSSEIRVGSCGEIRHPIVKAIANETRNRSDAAEISGARRMAAVKAESNIDLRLWHRATGVAKDGDRIASVFAVDLAHNRIVDFKAPLFVDATGDGWIGYWAGADFRMGREGRDETGESLAPEKGDRDTLGASIMWNSEETDSPVAFSAPWAEADACGYAQVEGEWFWETGLHADMTKDTEAIRDHMLAVIYGTFSRAKKKPENANRRLRFCPYLLGKRESRRLVGDHVLSQNEVVEAHPFPDAVATGSWSIDLHYDDVKPGVDFITRCDQRNVGRYWIPYRSLYSRNVPNLFVAGRVLSATHVAFGSTRVMNTLAQTGVAVGEAAAICKAKGLAPRDIWTKGHVGELQRAIGGDWPDADGATKPGWRIVDDEDSGMTFEGEGWLLHYFPNGGRTGLHCHSYDKNKPRPGKAVVKLPADDNPGRCELYFRVPYLIEYLEGSMWGTDATIAADLVNGGTRTRLVWNPLANTGEWNSLGVFDLRRGATLELLPRESDGEFLVDSFAVVPAAAEAVRSR